MKTRSPRSKKDVLDHIEDFIEEHIENKLKKGLDDVEEFFKRELKDLKRRTSDPDEDDDSGVLKYIEIFLKDRKVASVAPSSKFLVDRVLKRMNLRGKKTVIEFGPAAGVVTRPILDRLPSDGRVVSIELNKDFIVELEKLADPRLTPVHGSVLDVDAIAAAQGLESVDAIVSGIPFSFLKPMERHQLLHKIEALLKPGGCFVAYQVTAHLAALMKFHFPETEVDYEFRNLPPNFIFSGYK